MRKFLPIVFFSVLMISCEDEIEPDLGDAANRMVVDAFITNKPEPQHVFITRSQPYFEQSFPSKISGAEVFLTDLTTQQVYTFVENDSAYTHVPADTLGEIGNFYRLTINYRGDTYEAFSNMGRVPEIDSITFTFQPADNFITEDYFLAEFVATDLEGVGDAYWIKTFKNSNFLSAPNQLNTAFDAGFTPGGSIDGQVFIQPIQNAVNPIDTDDDNNVLPPYVIGDSINVEIHSISVTTFFFFQELVVQTNRPGGFGALFAQPLANVPTNIVPVSDQAGESPIGFFNMAAVSGRGVRFTENLASLAREEYERENP